MVSGAVWLLRSRIDAPSEAPGFDYLSSEVAFPSRNNSAFQWTANTEVKVFTLSNTGACLGGVTLLENSDAFMLPNSMGTNPGNQIDIFGLGSDKVYLGNYDITLATCADPDSDTDGVIDSLDQDDDGLTGTQEGDGAIDSDNDGIADAIEGHDANHNGLPDVLPSGHDQDGDELDDAYDPDHGGVAVSPPNTDGAGLPDVQDADMTVATSPNQRVCLLDTQMSLGN